MPQNYNSVDKNEVESQALIKSDKNNHAVTIKGKGSLLALTDSILGSAIAARKASQLSVNDDWMQRIWDWADEFELTEEQLPRNEKDLLALEKLNIEMCFSITFKRLLLSRAEVQESIVIETSRRERLAESGMLISPRNPMPSTHKIDVEIRRLEKLKATVNRMNYIPIEITHLKNLAEISLSGIESSNLIQDIRQLSNLT